MRTLTPTGLAGLNEQSGQDAKTNLSLAFLDCGSRAIGHSDRFRPVAPLSGMLTCRYRSHMRCVIWHAAACCASQGEHAQGVTVLSREGSAQHVPMICFIIRAEIPREPYSHAGSTVTVEVEVCTIREVALA